jgi:cytochrome c
MKNNGFKFLALCMFAICSGCASDKNNNDQIDLPRIPSRQEIDNYDYTLNPGTLDLARRSGCLACHAVDSAVVGPAWKAVSLRYKDYPPAANYLIDKVKHGGKGAWRNVPMPPYYPRVNEETIRALVERILQGEDGRVVLIENQPIIGQVFAGEIDRFELLASPNTNYRLDLTSSVGDTDLFVYDPHLPTDQGLVDSSESRTGADSILIRLEQQKYLEIEVLGYLDSEYELALSTVPIMLETPIPTEEELAGYNSYTLSTDTITLAQNSGCSACHATDSIVVGPSFKSISLRFKDIPGSEPRLIEKVHNGGKGYWGDAPMPPYSPRVSDQNIELLVNSILFGN